MFIPKRKVTILNALSTQEKNRRKGNVTEMAALPYRAPWQDAKNNR